MRLAALLFVTACGPKTECLERCDDFGISDPARCQEMCSEDCADYAPRFGWDVERCEAFQRGE